MKILLDLDGVLADLVSGLMMVHGKPWPFGYDAGNYGPSAWCINEPWRLTPAELWEPCDWSFWANLPKTPEADDIYRLAVETVGVGNVCMCTSPGHVPGAADGKRDWCRQHFPDVPVILAVEAWSCHNDGDGSGTPPKHFLAHRGVLLVDDNQDNCREFSRAGGHCFLWPSWWNDKHEQIDQRVELLRRELELVAKLFGVAAPVNMPAQGLCV